MSEVADLYRAVRFMPDGRTATVIYLTFGRAKITIGTGLLIYDDGW